MTYLGLTKSQKIVLKTTLGDREVHFKYNWRVFTWSITEPTKFGRQKCKKYGNQVTGDKRIKITYSVVNIILIIIVREQFFTLCKL